MKKSMTDKQWTPNRKRILINQLTIALEQGLYPAIEAAVNNKAPKAVIELIRQEAERVFDLRAMIRKLN